MGYDIKEDGFIVPEGWGPLQIDKEPDSIEYKRAHLQFKNAILDGLANNKGHSNDDSGDYGDEEFSDTQLIQFYFEETPDDKKQLAVFPFFKKVIHPKIEAAVTAYITANYKTGDDSDGTTDEQEDNLKKGLERYLVKLKTDNRDMGRALEKIADLDLKEHNQMFWHADYTSDPTNHEAIINLFFAEQFEGPNSEPGTIAEAEKLQVAELQDLNLTSGKGDAEHDKSWLGRFLEGAKDLGKDLLGKILPGSLIPDWARKSTVVDLDDLETKQVDDVRQCILVSDMLHDTSTGWSASYKSTWTKGPRPGGSHPATNTPFDGRIYPITTSKSFDPNTLINRCTVSKNTKKYLMDDDSLSPEMFYKLFWVYTDGEGRLNETEIFLSSAPDDHKWYDEVTEVFEPGESRAKQIRDAFRNGFGYSISKMDIVLKGMTPSTARKDVKANLTIELDNLKSLDAVCAYASSHGSELKIYDLVTLPTTHTVETKKTFNGGIFKDEFHPDYTRIRLKAWSYEGGLDPDNIETAMIYDLTCIDHKIERTDDGAGKATLEINYAGYFSAMMDMESNDALAPPSVISARAARRKKNAEIIRNKKCDDETRRKILKTQAEYDRLEAIHNLKTGTLVREMFKRGLMFGYNFNEEYVETKIVGTTLPPNENYLADAEWLGNITIKPPKGGGIINWMADASNSFASLFDADNPSMDEEGQVDAGSKDKGYPHYGFFLGDLMYVCLDCIYKDGTSSHHDWVKNMNMKFMVTSIPVPDPKDVNKLKLISPLAIPVDLKLFTRWFQEKVVKPEKTTYPVGLFIKDLMERLINDVIYDSCFSSTDSGHSAPALRVGYFTDHSKSWKSYNGSNGTYSPGDNLIMRCKPTSHVKDAKSYCVIYIQNPTYVQQLRSQKGTKLRNDPYTLPFYYGSNRKSVNYITNVSFKKTSQPFLREARHAQTDFGNLNLLANVYDLTFTIKSPKALTSMYPGNIINFILTDWAPDIEWEHGDFLGESDPHKTGTKAQILGFGGYYTVKSVKYTANLNVWNDFTIEVDAVFCGNDGNIIVRTASEDEKPVSKEVKACTARYNELLSEVQEFAARTGLEASVDSKIYDSDEKEKTEDEKEKKEEKEGK